MLRTYTDLILIDQSYHSAPSSILDPVVNIPPEWGYSVVDVEWDTLNHPPT